MNRLKGDSSCHIFTEKGRKNYDKIFRKDPAPDSVGPDEECIYMDLPANNPACQACTEKDCLK